MTGTIARSRLEKGRPKLGLCRLNHTRIVTRIKRQKLLLLELVCRSVIGGGRNQELWMSGQALGEGILDEFHRGVEIELVHNLRFMKFNRTRRDGQHTGDLFYTVPLS